MAATGTRPLRIGISSCFFHADPARAIFKGKTLSYLEQSLGHWVMAQGVLAYPIPHPRVDMPQQLHDYVADLDGLVLQGGSDVSPQSYGESAMKPEWNGDFIRDQYEIALVKAFTGRQKPVLGVCRGAQLLNVAYGGTLYQDIELQIPNALNHRNWDIYDQNFHQIEFTPNSLLEKWYGHGSPRKVNTIHHQALKQLGRGMQVEATSNPDGLVEAIRLEADHFVYAVQWHPEFHNPNDPSLLSGTPMLTEFLKEARRRRGG